MRDRIAIVDMNIKKFKVIPYKQYDKNNILRIIVTENGKLLNISKYTAVVNFKLPSKKVYIVPSTIEDNAVKIVLTEDLLKEYGKVIVEIEFSDSNQIVTTFSIFLNIEKSIADDETNNEIPDDDTQGDDVTSSHTHSNMYVLNQVTQRMIDTINKMDNIAWEDVYTKEEIDEKFKNINTDDIDLSDYYTKEEVDEQIKNISTDDIDLSDYVSKKELEDKKYATETYVKSEIANAQLGGGEGGNIDLSIFATKDDLNIKADIDDVPTNISQLINDSGYITESEVTEMNTQVNKNSEDITKILGIIDEPPIYTKPTLSVTSSLSNIEHNVQTYILITPKFTQNDSGVATSYSLSKNGETIYSNSLVNSYTDTVTLQHGESITYSAVVNYDDGVIKDTLLGIEYPETSIKKGSISSNLTIRAYALSYYGVIDSNTISDVSGLSSILRTSKGSTLTFNMTNQRVVYMYPKSFGNLTSIKDANNFDYINSYTLSNIILNNIEYNVYILTDAVTINGFKQIFN